VQPPCLSAGSGPPTSFSDLRLRRFQAKNCPSPDGLSRGFPPEKTPLTSRSRAFFSSSGAILSEANRPPPPPPPLFPFDPLHRVPLALLSPLFPPPFPFSDHHGSWWVARFFFILRPTHRPDCIPLLTPPLFFLPFLAFPPAIPDSTFHLWFELPQLIFNGVLPYSLSSPFFFSIASLFFPPFSVDQVRPTFPFHPANVLLQSLFYARFFFGRSPFFCWSPLV